jgi:hypothetical protein
MSKLILPAGEMARRALEDREKLPVMNVLTCGGCGHDGFRIFEDGTAACKNCNELAGGVKMLFGVEEVKS